MIQVDILDSSPIFIKGLAQVLSDEGIEVVSMRTTPLEEMSTSAVVSLMDPAAFSDGNDSALGYVEKVAQACAVVIMTGERECELAEAFRMVNAACVVTKFQSPEAIVDAIRVAAREAGTDGSAHDDGVKDVIDGPSKSLSVREKQVLQHISLGLTHRQVARRLGISPHTVDTYVKRVRFKLGIGNKAELTRVAVLGAARMPAPVSLS